MMKTMIVRTWIIAALIMGLMTGRESIAQSVDDLIKRAEESQEMEAKAYFYSKAAFEYHKVDPLQGLQYAEKAMGLQVVSDSILSGIYNAYAANHTILNDYGKAINYFKKALTHSQIANDTHQMAKIEGNLGMVYMELGDHQLSQMHLSKAMEIDSILGNLNGVNLHKYNKAILHSSISRYEESVSLLREVLQHAKAAKDSSMMGIVYSKLGTNFMELGAYNQAITYILEDALPLIRNTRNDPYTLAISYQNVGKSFLNKYKSLREDPQKEKSYVVGLLDQAEKYLDTAIIYSSQIGHNISLAYAKYWLGEVYELQGKPGKALEQIRNYIGISDTLFSRDKNIALARLETRQELELMQLNEEAALQKAEKEQVQKRGLAIILIMTLLGSLALIYLYRQAVQARNREHLEKQKSDKLLLNILPGEVAEELKSTGNSPARRYENVTVLFTDFVSFSSKSEVLSPEEIVRELDECFRAFDHIIEKHGLEKIKTIGDAYLAVAGLPSAQYDHAERCCRASIEIRDFIHRRLALGGLFDIRIGLHSGPVIAGIVGHKKYAYDIWGDTVNVAARLEQYSKPGKINISTSTKNILPTKYRIHSRGTILVKNGKEIDMHFLEEVMQDEGHQV